MNIYRTRPRSRASVNASDLSNHSCGQDYHHSTDMKAERTKLTSSLETTCPSRICLSLLACLSYSIPYYSAYLKDVFLSIPLSSCDQRLDFAHFRSNPSPWFPPPWDCSLLSANPWDSTLQNADTLRVVTFPPTNTYCLPSNQGHTTAAA